MALRNPLNQLSDAGRKLVALTIDRIPHSYRLPMVVMAVLVIGLLAAILHVSASIQPPPEAALKGTTPDQAGPTVAAPAAPAPSPVTELFNPTPQQSADQQQQSAANDQIDNILLNSYLLTKCNRMTPDEYNQTYQLLLSYAKMNHLASTLAEADTYVRGRVQATSASYQMIYGHLSCPDADLKGIANNLANWRATTMLAPIKPH